MSFSHRPTSAPQLRRRSEGDAEQARLYTQNSRLRASVEARAAGELVPHAELRSIHLAPQPEDEGASTAASSSADGPSSGGLLARTLSSLRRNLVPDDERVIALREQLATAASERDHARRERDQALRLVDNLRKQLHEERAASASATSAAVSVASDTSEGGDSAMTAEGAVSGTTTAAMRAMFEGMHVIASELHLHDVIERVIDITTRVLNCERVTLFLADERAEELFVLLSKDGLQARNSAQFWRNSLPLSLTPRALYDPCSGCASRSARGWWARRRATRT
jgi:hypothetical protein